MAANKTPRPKKRAPYKRKKGVLGSEKTPDPKPKLVLEIPDRGPRVREKVVPPISSTADEKAEAMNAAATIEPKKPDPATDPELEELPPEVLIALTDSPMTLLNAIYGPYWGTSEDEKVANRALCVKIMARYSDWFGTWGLLIAFGLMQMNSIMRGFVVASVAKDKERQENARKPSAGHDPIELRPPTNINPADGGNSTPKYVDVPVDGPSTPAPSSGGDAPIVGAEPSGENNTFGQPLQTLPPFTDDSVRSFGAGT